MHSNRKGVPGRFFIMKKVQVTITHKVTRMYPNRFNTYFSMTSPFDAERFSIMTPQQQERVLEMYGLNDSLPMQYVKYIKNMLKGDLGTSFTYVNQDVSKVITGRLGPSVLIGIQAVLIGLAVTM